MAEISYDRFEGGLDRRYNRPVGGANILWVLNNAYITTGKKIKKRPCFSAVATLEAGTAGLKAAGGVLNTFYGIGAITHANPLFKANLVAHPTLTIAVAKAHFAEMFNGFLYTAVEYTNGDVKHHYLDGTFPTYIADANCPNSKQVVKLSQKIYAARNGDVAFCATALPRNWTGVLDAGTVPASTNAAGSDRVTAVGNFNSKLAVFFSDSVQVWFVDPDPTNNALQSSSNSVGTLFSKTAQTLSQDLVYLGKTGFRSLSVTALTNNLQENDVGSAIDKLRAEIADTDDPRSIYYPSLGQLITFNGTRAYAYAFSRSNKLSAWSTYDFPFAIDDATVLNGELYVRSGDDVYKLDPTIFNDDGVAPLVEVEMFFQDGKAPGIEKIFIGFDLVVVGSPSIAFRYDPNDETLVTPFIPIRGDTRPGDLYPMELCATSIAPIWQHQANEDFQIDQMLAYYEKLGPV